VSRNADQVVQVRRLPDGRAAVPPVGEPEPMGSSLLTPVAVPAELDGRPVVVLTDPADPATFRRDFRLGHRVRALADGTAIGPLVTVPEGSLSGYPVTTVVDGTPVVVTTSDEGSDATFGNEQRTLRVFDMATGAAVGTSVLLPAAVTGLKVAMRNGAPVAVLGCADNAVRVVDLRTGTVGSVMTGHRNGIRHLVVVEDGERTVVVTEAGTSTSSEIRFWDLATGAPVGPVLRDHPARDRLLAGVRVDGRSLLVAGDRNGHGDTPGPVAVWDLAALLGGSSS
jgi:WD40 repeat protein